MKTRKNFNKWVHDSNVSLQNTLDGITTLCGKTARRMVSSKDKKKVTCPLCLEKQKLYD